MSDPNPRSISRRIGPGSLGAHFTILCSQFAPMVMTNTAKKTRYRDLGSRPAGCVNVCGRYWD
jgi:hypothetical protein